MGFGIGMRVRSISTIATNLCDNKEYTAISIEANIVCRLYWVPEVGFLALQKYI